MPAPPTRQGLVFDLQRFAIHDGPGIRTLVFLKGCPLRCVWCANPEGQVPSAEIMLHAQLCARCGACVEACPHQLHAITPEGHVFAREQCRACGVCAAICPTQALELSGRAMTVEEVLEVVLRDRAFYARSGGGLTLSGGEPLLQPDFALELLSRARQQGLHTAVETTGFVAWETLEAVRPQVDLFLYDIKETEEGRHRELTGVSLAPILQNLQQLVSAGAQVIVRAPLVPGLHDSERHLRALGELVLSFDPPLELDLVPYHRLGLAKWRALGRAYPSESAQPPLLDVVARWREELRAAGVRVLGG